MMLAGNRCTFRRLCISSTALAILLAPPAYAQSPAPAAATSSANSQQADSPAGPRPASETSATSPGIDATRTRTAGIPSTAPEFQAGASINVSDSYVTNAGGTAGVTRPDYLSTLGFSANAHEHSRRVNLDATYAFYTDFYARGSQQTQISNSLQALGNVDVVPDYFSIAAKAFAQPVVTSSLGPVTADNRVVANGYRNSYGYNVSPDLKFDFGNFATSETTPGFAQAFFDLPAGASSTPIIPGIAGPEDTTARSLTEKISSGPDFERFNWNLVGLFSETDRRESLLSEKAGIANLRYALSYEVSLLATGGYDAISNSTPLNKNVSGPVALAGIGLTFGRDFSLQVEAGTKYNSPSFTGNLLYNITPTSTVSASANDYVQTPEGQLLNNLSSLTTSSDGTPTGSEDLLGNGSSSSLASYSIQNMGSLSLDQNISRYQTASINYIQEFERNHINLGLFGTRRTILSGVFFGQPTQDSWGLQAMLSRDFTPLLVGTLGGTYSVNQEFGGQARTFQVQSQLSYSLGRQTNIYVRASYLDRTSSAVLQALSPFTGDVTDFRATIGLSRSL